LVLLYKATSASHSVAGIWPCAAQVVKAAEGDFARTLWGWVGTARKLPRMAIANSTRMILWNKKFFFMVSSTEQNFEKVAWVLQD
jgi:hypothetical protein